MTTTQNNQPLDEKFLDDAATEALGAHSVEESDAFVRRLAQATAEERKAARDLRETVARLATAAPYMDPPAGLRDKLLAATAPQSFKIEEYRRKDAEGGGFFRWGFAAAVLFLAGAAWFNYSLQTQVDTQNHQIAALQSEVGVRNDALAALTDPKTPKIVLQQNGETQGVLALSADHPVMVLPKANVPPGVLANIKMKLNGQETLVKANVIGAGSGTLPSVGNKTNAETELPNVQASPQPTYKADYPGLLFPGSK